MDVDEVREAAANSEGRVDGQGSLWLTPWLTLIKTPERGPLLARQPDGCLAHRPWAAVL